MATSAITPHEIPSSVASRLRGLRAKLSIWFLIDGLMRVLLLLLGVVVADFLLDWGLFTAGWGMDRAQRLILLVLAGAGLCYVLYRWLLRPLATHISDDALLIEVEHHYRELGESLISAVQFARMGRIDDDRVSPALVKATIDDGVRRAEKVPFGKVVKDDRLVLNSALLAIAILGLGWVGVAVANTEMMNTWFRRNVLLTDDLWPQDYRFEVVGLTDGRLIIPRGDDWPLEVIAHDGRRELPGAALELKVQFRLSGASRTEEMKQQNGAHRYRVDLAGVIEPFQFQVYSRGSQTGWLDAELVDRPAVEELKLAVTQPQYAGGAVRELPEGRGPYYVLKGGTLQVAGKATKPLSAATLTVQADSAHEDGEKTKAKTYPLSIVGQDGFELTLPPEEVVPATYRIELYDTLSLKLPGRDAPGPLDSHRPTPFTIRTQVDSEPQLRAVREGRSLMVVPGAKIPFRARVTDDFAITGVRLVYSWREDNSATPETEGDIALDEFAALKDQGRRSGVELEVKYTLELAGLKIPENSSLGLQFAALDNDDVSGPKEGRSDELRVRVVNESELRADILRREQEQQKEFARLLNQQDEVMTQTQEMLARFRTGGDLPDEERRELRNELMNLQKRQKLLATNIVAVAERMDEIIVDIRNNGLDDEGRIQRRLDERIIDPMKDLAAKDVPEAATGLDRARRSFDADDERNARLDEAAGKQQAIVAQMRRILDEMEKAEGYQDAVNLLYAIKKSQREVYELTDEERRKLAESEFGPLPEEKEKPQPAPSPKQPAEKPKTKEPAAKPGEQPDEKQPDPKKPASIEDLFGPPPTEKPAEKDAEKPKSGEDAENQTTPSGDKEKEKPPEEKPSSVEDLFGPEP